MWRAFQILHVPAILGALLGAAASYAADFTLSLSDVGRHVVAGATVTAVRQTRYTLGADSKKPLPAAGEIEFSGFWISDSKGVVQARGIPAGDYLLCVSSSNSAVLDPCTWSHPLRVSALLEREQRDLGRVTLETGSMVSVHVSDPNGFLTDGDSSSDGGIIVGIYDENNRWVPASKHGSGVDVSFSVVVPVGSVYRLWAFSRQFDLAAPGSWSIAGRGFLAPKLSAVAGEVAAAEIVVGRRSVP